MGNSDSKKKGQIHSKPGNTQHIQSVQSVQRVETKHVQSVQRVTAAPPLIPPQPFLTPEEFFDNWFLWKQSFLMYKASMPKKPETEWANILLNTMGPIGQDIYTTIRSPYGNEHLNVMFNKFDEYAVFKAKRRLPRENIYEYIDDLQTIVQNKNLENKEKIIKQRILSEIDESEFTTVAKTFMPKFVFASDYNKLMLKEIIFLWDFYISQKNCRKCGNQHEPNKCPAIGKQCQKCSEFNHYNRRCPLTFMFECRYCGGSHFIRKCPAYNVACAKCQKLNHFSWRCQVAEIVKCRFCGLSHTASRSLCPANKTFCIFCNTTGHFSSVCQKRHQSRRN